MERISWLVLLYALPVKRTTARVNLWRRLQKFGAVQLKTSAWILPDNAIQFERFQWLAGQIKEDGGDATLLRVREIEGLTDEDVRSLFNRARDEEYQECAAELRQSLSKFKLDAPVISQIDKIERRLKEIREIDYFHASKGDDLEMLLQKARCSLEPKSKKNTPPLLKPADYTAKQWLTRPKPGIDRVGSAWLIRRFIDPKAKFFFGPKPSKFPNAIPFDMANVEFSHHEDRCTFETLLARFGITDLACKKMGQMVHDTDLEDDKFHTVECFGIQRILEGYARRGFTDEDIVSHGIECFEALYHSLQD